MTPLSCVGNSFWVALLLLMCCLSSHLADAQIRQRKLLKVAVEDADIFKYLSGLTASSDLLKAAFPDVATMGISLSFVYVPIGDSLGLVSNTDAVQTNLSTMGVSAVISDYYISLAIATYSLDIPYFVIRKKVFSFPPPGTPNIFEIEIDNFHMGQALYDISVVYKRTTLVVVSDGSPQSSQFLVNFAGRIFAAFTVNASKSDDDIFAVFARFNLNSLSVGMGWILLFDEPNLPLMERTLAQASRAGIFVQQQFFFIPSLFDKQKYLTRFYRGAINILTFMIAGGKQYGQQELLQPFVLDCLNHYLKAYKAWSNMADNISISNIILNTPSIQNPLTGLFVYNPVSRVRALVQIDVVHTNASKPPNATSIYSLAGSWQIDNTGAPPYKLNYSGADDISESRIVFVAYESAPYFYDYNPVTNTGRGLSLEMVEVLRAKMGFEYKVIVNSSRNDALKMLKDGHADVSLNFMTPTSDRLNYTDASIDMVQDGVQMLVRKVVRGLNFRHIFHPFSLYVWVSIGISIILLSVTFFACDKISPNLADSQLYTPLQCFYVVLSSFLLSKSHMEPKKVSSRLFMLLLRFSTLMYIMMYLSTQVALLIQSDEQTTVSNVGDLETLDGYKWGFVRDSLFAAEIQANWPNVYARAQREWPSEMFFDSMQDALARLLSDSNFILIDSADTLSYVKNTDCRLMVMGSMADSHQRNWLFRKGFPFVNELNNQLSQEKTGSFIQLRSKYFDLNRCYSGQTDIENKVQLGFEYLNGLFILLGIGMFLGFLQLLCRWISLQVQEWRLIKDQMIRFKPGQLYEAEVYHARPDGVWIRLEGESEVRFMDNSGLELDSSEDAFKYNSELRGKKIQVQYIGTCGVSGVKVFKRSNGGVYTVDRTVDESAQEDSTSA